ncbi:hypothetical protein GXM_10311 [Nostoc sphaeroides CCNUC1]|uniref:Uncharacterized protein n=1 Tax=Nostoc sphaeroides CCNUC1 TaxID=2653204 RepID=A0A5P8WK72_9NOSO|nr:hypothetical protein GXM_10311 [Nostoc sphaeroides CCNUC1]
MQSWWATKKLFDSNFVRGNQNSYLPRMIEAIRYINTGYISGN